MELARSVSPAFTQLIGEQGDIVVSAGQQLIIETSPGGTEVLDATVPAGTQWTVTISVDVRETDV